MFVRGDEMQGLFLPRFLIGVTLFFGLGSGTLAQGFDERLFLEADGEVGLVEGTIGPESYRRVSRFLQDHPEIEVLVLLEMPGSIDDEVNLRLARQIRALGIDTYVPAEADRIRCGRPVSGG